MITPNTRFNTSLLNNKATAQQNIQPTKNKVTIFQSKDTAYVSINFDSVVKSYLRNNNNQVKTPPSNWDQCIKSTDKYTEITTRIIENCKASNNRVDNLQLNKDGYTTKKNKSKEDIIEPNKSTIKALFKKTSNPNFTSYAEKTYFTPEEFELLCLILKNSPNISTQSLGKKLEEKENHTFIPCDIVENDPEIHRSRFGGGDDTKDTLKEITSQRFQTNVSFDLSLTDPSLIDSTHSNNDNLSITNQEIKPESKLQNDGSDNQKNTPNYSKSKPPLYTAPS